MGGLVMAWDQLSNKQENLKSEIGNQKPLKNCDFASLREQKILKNNLVNLCAFES